MLTGLLILSVVTLVIALVLAIAIDRAITLFEDEKEFDDA